MIDWDMQDGVTGVLLMILGCALLDTDPLLGILGILGGGYNFYTSFVTIDPDGV